MLRTILWIGSCLWALPALADSATTLAPPPQPLTLGTASLGFQELDGEGSFPRFGQYLLPPEGLFLEKLLLSSQDQTGHTLFQAQLYDLGEDYHRGAVSITPAVLNYSLHYRFDRARFFPEPTFRPRPQVGRRTENTFRFHAITTSTQFNEVRFQHLRVLQPGLQREGRLAYLADNVDLRGIWPVGPGQIDLRYSELTFMDSTGRQPTTTIRTYAAEYSIDLGEQTNVAAAFAHTHLGQAQVKDGKVQLWRVAGAYTPNSRWDAQARYERRTVDLGLTQNAYTRLNATGTLKVTCRPRPDLAVRLAYEQRDMERFNSVRTRIDAPQWHILRVTANWKSSHQLGIDTHYEWRDLQDNPNRGQALTRDLRPLTPDRERRFEIKANRPFLARGFAYALFRDRRRENEARRLSYRLRTLGIGSFYQATPRLSVEATWGRDDWQSSAAELNAALADAQVLTLSGQYAVSPQAWVSSTYSRYRGNQASTVDDDQWSLSAGYTCPQGGKVTLSYQNGDYENVGFPILNYDVDRWKITYSSEF